VKSAWVRCLLLAALLLAIACSVRTPAPPQDAVVGPGGTSWQLVRFQGSDDKLLTPDEPAKFQAAETLKWGKVIKAAGIAPE